MAAKPSPPPRRGGPTQPETSRVNQQVLLRLPPDAVDDLAELAERWGKSKSVVVADLIERAMQAGGSANR